MRLSRLNQSRAFTKMEAVVVVAVLMVLAICYVWSKQGKDAARRIACVGNQKQIGIAFRIWARDHQDQYPMLISTNAGGTMEFVGGPDTFRHFQVMSNELNTPRILHCPSESKSGRKWSTYFGRPRAGVAGEIPFAGNTNLSYFVGVDATDLQPQRLLSGDRNVTNDWPVRGGLLELTTNRPVGWTREIHVRQGNVSLADGSVRHWDSPGLQQGLQDSGVATNRLAMP